MDAVGELAWVHVVTVATCFVSGLLPLVNAELYLVGVAGYTGGAALPTLALAAAIGQMGAKTVCYYAGMGALKLRRLARYADKLEQTRQKLEARKRSSGALLFASSFTGLPPFLLLSVAAGALRVRLAPFLVIGTIGRFLRFAIVLAAPAIVLELLR